MIPFQQFLGGHGCNKGHSLWYKSLTLFPPPLTFLIWAPLVPVESLNASSASLLPRQACLTWEAAPCTVAEYWTNIRTALALPGALSLLPLFCFLDEGKRCHHLLPESPGCPPNKELSLQLRLPFFFFGGNKIIPSRNLGGEKREFSWQVLKWMGCSVIGTELGLKPDMILFWKHCSEGWGMWTEDKSLQKCSLSLPVKDSLF